MLTEIKNALSELYQSDLFEMFADILSGLGSDNFFIVGLAFFFGIPFVIACLLFVIAVGSALALVSIVPYIISFSIKKLMLEYKKYHEAQVLSSSKAPK